MHGDLAATTLLRRNHFRKQLTRCLFDMGLLSRIVHIIFLADAQYSLHFHLKLLHMIRILNAQNPRLLRIGLKRNRL